MEVFATNLSHISPPPSIGLHTTQHKEFILFDKKNIIKIDEGNIPSQMTSEDNMNQDYDLWILKCFDVIDQCLLPIQFLVVHEKTITFQNLLDYIQNSFIALNERPNEFEESISKSIKKIKEKINPKQSIFKLYASIACSKCGVLAIQLNRSLSSHDVHWRHSHNHEKRNYAYVLCIL